ncbi:SCP2 sterol-binding domain-containing protein [Amaricoccus macauensis]|uniref:SCP2 sterol-binding domain-containing protein n=1 Tax=Amaricoccus macauensis TaxID=57001 RepID=UPI003C7A63C8
MSKVIEGAVRALEEKLDGDRVNGSVRFVIENEGSIRVDESGVREDDSEADCTLRATRETFEGLLEGQVNPAAAFMTGRLKVDGDMGLAMKLGSLLT